MTPRPASGWKMLNGRRVPLSPKMAKIVAALMKGEKYPALAKQFGISKQRIHQIRVVAGLPARRGL